MKSIEISIQTRKINRNSKKRRTTPHKSSNQKKIQKTINSKHFDPKKGLHMAHSMKKTKIYKTTLKTPYSHKKHQFWTQNSHKTHKTATKQPKQPETAIFTQNLQDSTQNRHKYGPEYTQYTQYTQNRHKQTPQFGTRIYTQYTQYKPCAQLHTNYTPPNCTLINSSFGTRNGTSIWGSKWDA